MSCTYHPLCPVNVDAERKELRKIGKIVDKLWQNEVSLYEKDEAVQNLKEGPNMLVNPLIFPYHKALFPLLDIYHLISGKSFNWTLNSPTHVFDEVRRISNEHEVRVSGYLPCSAVAVWRSLVPRYRAEESRLNFLENHEQNETQSPVMTPDSMESTDFSFLEEWYCNIKEEKLAWALVDDSSEKDSNPSDTMNQRILSFDERIEGYIFDSFDSKEFGLLNMPAHTGDRTKILLKLLKHSMSDLQRDHRLARAVIYAMIEFRCFDFGEESTNGVDALRYLLAIVQSERIKHCAGECHEIFINTNEGHDESSDDSDPGFKMPRPDHYCSDWKDFECTINSIIAFGIDLLSEKHAEVLCAFVIQQFEEAGFVELKDGEGCWNDDFEEEPAWRLSFIIHIVIGLGVHAYIMRSRMKKLLIAANSNSTVGLNKKLQTLSSSYLNAIRALVDIGENTLRRVPASNQNAWLGGYLVCALVTSMSDEATLPPQPWDQFKYYLGNHLVTDNNKRLMNYKRYYDSITNASNQRSIRVEEVKKCIRFSCNVDMDCEIVRSIFLSPVHQDVQDVVRGLFLRQLVDVRVSGCGYGDFLVWNRLPVSPMESLIFEHEANYPESDEDQIRGCWGFEWDNNEKNCGKPTALDWEQNEKYCGNKLAAHYDFSLLMMNRAWSLPWTPNSNASFQLPFRQAINTLALCTQRYGIPSVLLIELFQFLPRNWWPEERAECWRYDCQLSELSKLLKRKSYQRKAAHDGITNSSIPNALAAKIETKSFRFLTCQSCSIARACSQKHLKRIEGHRFNCSLPPFRPFCAEDDELCQYVIGNNITSTSSINHGSGSATKANKNDEATDSDDSGSCWESIGSDDESTSGTSKVDLIYRYFENHKYKLQRLNEPAFANFFSDQD